LFHRIAKWMSTHFYSKTGEAVNIQAGSNGSLITICMKSWMAVDFRCQSFFMGASSWQLVSVSLSVYSCPWVLVSQHIFGPSANYKVSSTRDFFGGCWAPLKIKIKIRIGTGMAYLSRLNGDLSWKCYQEEIISVILKIKKKYMEYLKKHLDSIFCAEGLSL